MVRSKSQNVHVIRTVSRLVGVGEGQSVVRSKSQNVHVIRTEFLDCGCRRGAVSLDSHLLLGGFTIRHLLQVICKPVSVHNRKPKAWLG